MDGKGHSGFGSNFGGNIGRSPGGAAVGRGFGSSALDDTSAPAAPLLRIDPLHPQPKRLRQAAELARAGGVLILPTDTVYGIAVAIPDAAPVPDAAKPHSAAAPDILYKLKGRDANKAIPWLVSGIEVLEEYMECLRCAGWPRSAGNVMYTLAKSLASRHWPGALTLVVPASKRVPPGFMAADGSIALRAPNHSIVQGILAELGRPLATSSANLQGEPPATSVQNLDPRLVRSAGLIIDGGPATGGLPSTIVSCTGSRPQLLREGAIPAAALMLD